MKGSHATKVEVVQHGFKPIWDSSYEFEANDVFPFWLNGEKLIENLEKIMGAPVGPIFQTWCEVHPSMWCSSIPWCVHPLVSLGVKIETPNVADDQLLIFPFNGFWKFDGYIVSIFYRDDIVVIAVKF